MIATSDGRARSFRSRRCPSPIFMPRSWRGSPRLRSMSKSGRCRSEVVDATPFTERTAISDYRPEIAERLWRIFSIADMALKRFRGELPRQVESVARLLGQLRPRDDALFGAHGAAASGRHSEPRRLGDARGLFARSLERRFLAGHAGASSGRHSMRTPTRSRRASPRRRWTLRRSIIRRCASSCSPMTICARSPTRRPPFRTFFAATYNAAADLGRWPRDLLERR